MSPRLFRLTSQLIRSVFAVSAATVAACGGGAGNALEAPPVIGSFSASPTDTVTGHRVTLGWTADGATSLSISGIGTVTGTHIDVNPADDTEYVLTASNSAGSAQARVQVTIYPPPEVWFSPYAILGGSGPGSLDYFDLFNSDAPWTQRLV